MSRNAPARLPDQALPPDKRKKSEPPPAFEDTLPSGLHVTWRMPDPFTIIAFDDTLPDPITAAVITLLREEKAYTSEFDPMKFRYDSQSIKGMYGIAAAMLEQPRLDPAQAYGDGDGTLGRREMGYLDVCALYWKFRTHTRLMPIVAPDGAEPGGPALAPPDSDGVPPDAGAAGGDP